ncbi:MAG: sulfite oxidase [Pseudomonadota bacterium]|nr:sulfite oxidase [Pseudomonadota bacterium]
MKHNRRSQAPHSATRRNILKAAGAAGFGAALGAPVVFAQSAPAGFVPVLLLQGSAGVPGKTGLTLLGDRPLNMETPPHLLDDDATPAERFFVRNNGLPPDIGDVADEDWRLKIDGEVAHPFDLSIADLKHDFETVTLHLPVECGGNGRKFYRPAASGNQWTFGAVGFGVWTGVRLADVLDAAGVKPGAVYTGHYGADRHLSGDPAKHPISRGVPIEKALEPHTLIAWALNGAPLPPQNGYPLRLVVPGWPGSCSQKWLTRIWVRDRVHDGEKMGGDAYRMPTHPVPPGAKVSDSDMEIITSMPVKSLITFPATGAERKSRAPFEVRGHAWSGETPVAAMHISADFGATWQEVALDSPTNKYASQRWRATLTSPEKGYYEIWARATDAAGVMQPPTPPGWNPKGYLNNMQHRIGIFAV